MVEYDSFVHLGNFEVALRGGAGGNNHRVRRIYSIHMPIQRYEELKITRLLELAV